VPRKLEDILERRRCYWQICSCLLTSVALLDESENLLAALSLALSAHQIKPEGVYLNAVVSCVEDRLDLLREQIGEAKRHLG
jgi:hypothetical protein